MQDRLDKIIENYSIEDHATLSGPDWPNFESIKTKKNIPDFVIKELLEMYVLLPKIFHYMEFYITNVCNYDCSDCRSFNNFNFKGHYKFDLDLYKKWAEKLELKGFVLLGGEPLLHPDLESWIRGTRMLWPTASAKIDTNGSYISKFKGLHRLLVDNNFFLCINIHNPSKKDEIMEDIFQSFGKCEKIDTEIVRSSMFRGHHIVGECLISELGLLINLRPANRFQKSITTTTNWQMLSKSDVDKSMIYIGDAKKSHESCLSKVCHVMLEGKIYKCATMATLPIFLDQKNLRWPDKMLYDYEPLTLENYSQEKIDEFKYEIPQCSFCQTESRIDISNSNIKKNKKKFFSIQPAF